MCINSKTYGFIIFSALLKFNRVLVMGGGMHWCSGLKHCATSWKVTGSIPDKVIGIFHSLNPSGYTMALGLTQPLTEMSTRDISLEGRVRWCVGLTTLPPSCAHSLEILGASTSWSPNGLSRPV
jgi:hypothetical protein